MRVSRAEKCRNTVVQDLKENARDPGYRGTQVDLAGSDCRESLHCSSNVRSAVTMAGGDEDGKNVHMEEYNTVDVDGIVKEGPESPGFDLENALAAGPIEDCSDGSSIPCKKVHMSGDNISLYVEISSSKCETLCETEDEVGNNEEARDLQSMEETSTNGCQFTTGDVVWVKTKNKIWWPGKIRNPSEFAKHRVKARPQGCLLVSYMANGHVSWYRPSQLKPFHEDFVHRSRQDKSKTFIAAVEKSMDEFGLHLKSRLVSLASPQAQGLACGIGTKYTEFSMAGALGEVSATLLNSRDLISRLKNLALDVSKPRVLEPAILGSYVSAFYCSLMSKPEVVPAAWGTEPSDKSNNKWGHKFESDKGIKDIDTSEVVGDGPQTERKSRRKKVVENFTSKNDGDTNVESVDGHKTGGKRSSFGSSGKGSELRPRKKSKYLSYPYINVRGKQVPAKVGDDVAGSGPVAKLSSTFRQKLLDKLGKISVEELSRISSIELLLGLRIAASGFLYPVESEHLERVEVFFYRFRSSSFDGDSCTQGISNAEKGKQNEEACEDKAKNHEELRRTNLKFPAIILTEADERKESPEKSNLEFPLTAIENVGGKKEKLGETICASIFSNIDKNGRNLEDSKPSQILLEAMNIGIMTPLQFPAKESSGLADLTSVGSSSVQSKFSGGSGVPVHVGFTEGNHARNKGARMDKDVIEPSNIVEARGSLYDASGTQTCANSSDKDSQGPNLAPAQTDPRKRKRKGRGTPIILTFAEGNPVPPKDILEAEFSKFGPLQSVIAPSPGNPNVARVTFFKKKDASKAHQSLEMSNPFGGALVKFELQLLFPSKALENLTMRAASFSSGASSINPLPNFLGHTAPTVDGPTSSLTQVLSPALSLTPGLTPVLYPAPNLIPVLPPAPTSTSVPPLDHIKHNLEMMFSMLKESGHELSPETRAKLELEIKRLLRKVNYRIRLSSS